MKHPMALFISALIAFIALVAIYLLTYIGSSKDRTPPPLPERTFHNALSSSKEVTRSPLPDLPRGYLSIDELDISAKIDPAGITASPEDGNIYPPDDARQIGYWGDLAPLNAFSGTTVLIGHVQTVDIARGALWNLAYAKPGTTVVLNDFDARKTSWRIVSLDIQPKDDIDSSIFSDQEERRLVIVTCGGENQAYNVIATAIPIYTD